MDTKPDFYWFINRPPNDFELPMELYNDLVTATVLRMMETRLCPHCGQYVLAPADFHICPIQMFRSIRRGGSNG